MATRFSTVALLVALGTAGMLAAACGGIEKDPVRPPRPPDPPPHVPDVPVPLTDVSGFPYYDLPGGLYPGGLNGPPVGHAADGHAALALVQPLDLEGRPDPEGRIVFVSVGMSNVAQEFCSAGGFLPCTPWSFMGKAATSAEVDRARLVIVNGAAPGDDVSHWDQPSDLSYERVRHNWLEEMGLSENQVQVAWVKQAIARPRVFLPDSSADAYQLEVGLGRIVRAMKTRWPNLRIVFFSSRIYGGYSTIDLHPEPFAYESGFAVRGVIAAQITQRQTSAIDPQAGDVGLAGGAPWLVWGPYLWADGERPRGDGLVWRRGDFAEDGVHPSTTGEEKVADLLLAFFRSSPFAQCWFLAGRACQS